MAHYTILDNNNKVLDVLTGVDEDKDGINWEEWYLDFYKENINPNVKDCKRTSYNTRGNIHENGNEPFRKNYASKGYTYNETLDAFIPPKPYTTWTLNEETCQWECPVPYPVSEGGLYRWDDETTNWIDLEN